MSEDEARREAQRVFGDLEQARRELLAPERRRQRRVRAGEWLRDVGRDVRYGTRSLLRAPAFTGVAVLTLALGIGATTALFSVVNAVLLQPLPFPEPHELVMIFEAHEERGADDRNVVNPANFNDWRERSRAVELMAAAWSIPVTVLTGGEPREVVSQYVHQDFFRTLGVAPLVGRDFTVEDAALPPGQAQVVLLSEGFWRGQLGADPGVVGRTLELVGTNVQVVGVMPEAVEIVARDAAFWMPSDYAWGSRQNSGRFITVVGRLAEGVTIDAAQSELSRIAGDLRSEHPDFNARWSANVVPLTEHLSGDVRLPMLLVLAAVGMLLLIACVNVASLFLARAATRSTEIAVRASLGAGRGRIARALLVESLVLALLGGVAGLVLAFLATRVLVTSVPASLQIPRLASASVDGNVLGFALLATLATGVLFGLAPVAEAFRINLAGSVREGSRGAGGGRGARRTRATLVVAEIALAVVLLAGAGLLLRSLLALQRTDLGFEADEVVTGRVTLRGERYGTAGSRHAFFDQAIGSIGAIAGVQSVGVIWWLPLSGGLSATSYYLPDRPRPAAGEYPSTQVQAVQGDLFRALDIALLQGRDFDARDVADGARVAIVNRAFAERTWPGENPIGKRFIMPWGEDRNMEVVGVVEDIRHRGVEAAPEPTVFMPHAQFPLQSANLIVRTAATAGPVQRELLRRINEIDPNLAVADLMPLRDVVADAVARPRLTSMLVAVFAALALLLAAVGIYGLVAYSVTLRIQEMGVRRALGAQSTDLTRMVLGNALRLGGAGIAIGVVFALLATRLLQSLLYGVRAADPLVFAGTAALLLAVTMFAALVPALRASRVSPTEALRYN